VRLVEVPNSGKALFEMINHDFPQKLERFGSALWCDWKEEEMKGELNIERKSVIIENEKFPRRDYRKEFH
jgi:hypothetical protein